ncbi:DUF1905 domain-containing protein [Planctomonas sp. JC2975]|nr:DUF1905 domain-containing protein [Planctomonas sp. JC2975]
MEFQSIVEPPEPMHGLEVPASVVEALGAGKRPRIRVTLGDHTWSTRIAIMRGRNLIGLSNANRAAAGVATGEEVTVAIEVDSDPTTVTVPDDVAAALETESGAREGFDRLTPSQRKQRIRVIEQAKTAPTRERRIAALLAEFESTD